ncbi:MAG: peroxiredoxin family protein [Gemmatimonadaceae bacterium]
MTERRQWMVVGGVIALLASGAFAATRILGDELVQVSVGSRAPEFHALTLDEVPRGKTLADYRGEVVLLNIWATYCLPCRVEMPSLERLHSEFAPRGLKVVAVSIDVPGKEEEIRQFAREYGLTFELLFDEGRTIARDYQTTGVPETIIIGRDGRIRHKRIGAVHWDSESNRALVASLLAEPAG